MVESGLFLIFATKLRQCNIYQLIHKTITTMAEDLKKKDSEQLNEEQLDEVSGGENIIGARIPW